jgi:ferric-dicitrate binding protein FerR (iron transport regulator)
MKNSHQYSHAMDEIAKYLSGEMDDLQKAGFEERLASDAVLKADFLETKAVWDQMDYLIAGDADNIDTDGAWSKVMSRIELDESADTRKNHFFLPMMLRVAAAVLFIAGIGWLALLLHRSQQENMLVFENTGNQTTAVRTLLDGSMVYLAQESNISFSENFGSKSRIVELNGEAFFDVAHDYEKPFIIKTGTARIEVLGTSFNVKSYNDSDFELFVETGRVKVSFSNGSSVYVEPRQLATFKNGSYDLVYNADYNTQWRKNLLHFRDEKLGDILYVLGKTYGITFETSHEHLRNRMMTLTIYDSSANTISELISLSLGIDYEIKNDSLVVFRPK